MRQSLEIYFLINLAVDTALIAVVARANGCFRFRRVIAGGLLSAIYALLVRTVSFRLAHPAIQFALILPVSLIVSGDPEPRIWLSVAFQLSCGALILGGIGGLTSGSPIAGIGGGLLLLGLLLNIRTRRLSTWEVIVCLRYHGKSVSFRALIDTGNRLHEPISGLPVLIVEASLLRGVFPSENDVAASCRRVAFGALGGGGTVRCFRPDSVLIRHGKRLIPAPEVWVAAYPGKIPGSARALAPPSFAIIPGNTHPIRYTG